MKSKEQVEELYRAIRNHRKKCGILARHEGMCSNCHEGTLGVLDWLLGYANRSKYVSVLLENDERKK